MARKHKDDYAEYLVLTKKEAVEVIAYLAAQLGNTVAPNSQAGACPVLIVDTHPTQRQMIALETNPSDERQAP